MSLCPLKRFLFFFLFMAINRCFSPRNVKIIHFLIFFIGHYNLNMVFIWKLFLKNNMKNQCLSLYTHKHIYIMCAHGIQRTSTHAHSTCFRWTCCLLVEVWWWWRKIGCCYTVSRHRWSFYIEKEEQRKKSG